jgi:hypothetical protein
MELNNAAGELTNRAKSRKFIFSVGTALMASLLVWAGSIDAATYAQISNVTILGYLTGNVAESFLKK